ncbi:MAG: hypothetical protein QM654_15730 [Dysgonamonadaceae bacterium]
MRNLRWLGWTAVVVGSFLPLVHVPVIGNWNYWSLDYRLAIICWVFSALALCGILMEKRGIVKIASILLLLLFSLTIVAVKIKAMDSFSIVFIKSFQKSLAGIVKLQWGWFVEFSGALIMLLASVRNKDIAE